MGLVIRQNDENQNSLISEGDDETGFEYIESEVSADDPGIGVQWEVRKMVWNSEDGFGQNSKPSGLLDLFLTPDICLCISHLQIQVGQKAANALKAKHGTNYRVGSSADILCKYLFFFASSIVSKAQKKSVDFGVGWGGQDKSVPWINRKLYKSK